MDENNDEIIIFSNGVNGSAVYSAYTEKGRNPIITNKGLLEFSKSMIRLYPDSTKKIHKFYESSFSGELPKEINMAKMDPNHKAELIEKISLILSY